MFLTVELIEAAARGISALIHAARTGAATVQSENGRVLTVDEVNAKFDASDVLQAHTSQDTAGRIDQRRRD